MKLSYDEYEICKALIYNLDKNGCYGNNLLPKSLLNPSRPLQNQVMLEKCIEKIQRMDPIGTCCKNLEESLFVQAKIAGDASDLTLFLLDGNLSMLNPPHPEKILKKINGFLESWHKKAFAPALIIDDIEISEEDVQESLEYILKLNPKPAAEYFSDSSFADSNLADVALIIEKKQGFVAQDDEEKGIGSIHWLQSVQEPAFALPVMDPLLVKADYNPEVDDELLKPIGKLVPEELLVMVTVTVPSDLTKMTVNLKGPIIINAAEKKACQVIVEGDGYAVKYPIYDILNAKKAGE